MTQRAPSEPGDSDVNPSRGPFARLLVPVDFSAASRAALELAILFAEQWGTGSEVVVFNAPGRDDNDEFLLHTGVPWGRRDVIDETRDHLRLFAEAVVSGRAGRVRLDASRDDDPVRAVVRACERIQPSLVVLGTHGRDRRRWRRSRAERIVRAIVCPVILVRAEREVPVDLDS